MMESMMIPKPKPVYEHKCGWCGNAFSSRKETSKYCSFSCSMSALHHKPMIVEKRTLGDIELPESLRIEDIPNYVYKYITSGSWPYKGCEWAYGREYYEKRDRAMMSLGFLACGRINEILRVDKSQVDFDGEPGFIVVHNYYVSKRKQETLEREGPTLIEIPIPKSRDALLHPFTELFTEYFEVCETERLFPISESRAWEIVKASTGLWTHWFRSLGLSYFANMIRNPFALAKIYGVKNVNVIMRYFKTEWTQYKDVYTLISKTRKVEDQSDREVS